MLGVATVLTVMGLVSSLAGFLLVEFRGYLLVAAGIVSVLLAAAYLEMLPMPALPGLTQVPAGAGPYLFGMTFALVSSPCASPVLFAVLGVAATSGSAWLGGAIMATYSVAFTAVLFLAGLSVGLARRAGKLAAHGRLVELAGGVLLGAAGAYLLATGIRWFM